MTTKLSASDEISLSYDGCDLHRTNYAPGSLLKEQNSTGKQFHPAAEAVPSQGLAEDELRCHADIFRVVKVLFYYIHILYCSREFHGDRSSGDSKRAIKLAPRCAVRANPFDFTILRLLISEPGAAEH